MEIQSKCFPSKTSFLKDSFVDVLTYLSPPPNLSVLLPSNFSESCRHGMAGLGYSCAKQLVKGAYFFFVARSDFKSVLNFKFHLVRVSRAQIVY